MRRLVNETVLGDINVKKIGLPLRVVLFLGSPVLMTVNLALIVGTLALVLASFLGACTIDIPIWCATNKRPFTKLLNTLHKALT